MSHDFMSKTLNNTIGGAQVNEDNIKGSFTTNLYAKKESLDEPLNNKKKKQKSTTNRSSKPPLKENKND